ncbi:hypothetical protein HYT52_05310 [Candidatus Woesearchaeota archaeon]|nr:hypothetical protein [Candidatus Woesearchaeota archaeon]
MEFPAKDFSIRGIARELKLSHATILNYISDLQKLSLINKKEATLYPTYFANTENQKYKLYKSDIDIFVEAKESKLDLVKYEKKLKHTINILFEKNINDISKELRNNIINGVVLYGFVKIQ